MDFFKSFTLFLESFPCFLRCCSIPGFSLLLWMIFSFYLLVSSSFSSFFPIDMSSDHLVFFFFLFKILEHLSILFHFSPLCWWCPDLYLWHQPIYSFRFPVGHQTSALGSVFLTLQTTWVRTLTLTPQTSFFHQLSWLSQYIHSLLPGLETSGLPSTLMARNSSKFFPVQSFLPYACWPLPGLTPANL